MPIQHRGILRLAYVHIALQDPDPAVSFYTERLGLLATDATARHTMLRCWHEPYRFSYVVERADADRLVELAFEVRDGADLDALATAVAAAGAEVTRSDADAVLPGVGASISFVAPGGHRIRLTEGLEQPGYVSGPFAPDWNPPGSIRGCPAPLNLLHAGITVPDPAATVAFFTDVLGFGVADRITSDADPGTLLSALLFRTTNGQDLAIFPGPAGGLHHVGFLVEDETDVLRSAAYLTEGGALPTDPFGTTVQLYGNTFSCHLKDPAGVRLEVFSGGRYTELHPEFAAVTWTESALPQALAFIDTAENKDFLAPCL